MGLVDDLIKEQERRKLSRLETLEAEASRRDLDTSLGGAANLRDDRGFFTNAVTNPLKRGTVESFGNVGSGVETVGTRLQHPRRELTVKERQQSLNQEIGKDLAKQVADSEKWMMDDTLVASHIPTNLELKSMHETPSPSQTELEEAFTPVGDTYTGERSTMKLDQRAIDPRTGDFAKRKYKDIPFEEMSPLEKNIQIAKNAVGKPLETWGSEYAEDMGKVIEYNPQWQFPEHLQGRPAFKSLWADDLTFEDKATIVMGGFFENAFQIGSTVALTVGGTVLGGPAGGMAGGAISLGGNFLLETGGVYSDIVEAYPDVDRGEAAGTAILHGTVATLMEVAPVGMLLNKIPGVKKAVMGATLRELLRKPRLVRRVIRGMVEQGAVESITEGFQEISANAAKGVFEQNPEYFKDVDESMFMGFIMGVVTAGLANMTTHRSAVKQFNDERLVKLSSEQLLELASDKELLAQEQLSPEEVYAAAEQVRIIEGLKNVDAKMKEGGYSLEDLAGTEAEQAARYLARIRNPERATSISKARAMIREKNLSDKDLQLLMKSTKALEEVGLLPKDITSLVEERAEEQRYVKHFESMLENAPSDAMRQGIMDSLQGAYYQGISRVLEAKGKEASRSDLMKGEVKIPEKKAAAKKKTVAKKKPVVKKKAAEDLTGPEIAAMSPEERARTVLGEEAKPEEVEILTKQIVAFQEKEKVKTEAKPEPKLELKTVYKTKAAAMVAINKIEGKEGYSILKTKEGFKIIAEPALGSSKPVLEAASKGLGSEVRYDSSMDQGEDYGVWHSYTFLSGPAEGGSFTVIKEANVEPTAEEIVEAGRKIVRLREPLGSKKSDKLYATTKDYILQQFDDGVSHEKIIENMVKEGWDKDTAESYFTQMKHIDRLKNPDRWMNKGRTSRTRWMSRFNLEAEQSKTNDITALDFIARSRWDFNRSKEATVDEMVELGWTKENATKFHDLYETVRSLEGNKEAITEFIKKNPKKDIRRLFRAAKVGFDSMSIRVAMAGAEQSMSSKSVKEETGVTVAEVEAKVKKLLGGIPKFIKITEELDPEVQKALDNRTKSGAIPLASTKELFKAPKWTSRIITDFVDQGGKKGGHKTADQWIIAIQQWTTDKTKKGKVVEGSAQMPPPVRDELLWSGLPEWLEDRKDRELPTTKEDIIEYLEKYNRYVFTERIYGYDYRKDVAKTLSEIETKSLYKEQDDIKRSIRKTLQDELYINWNTPTDWDDILLLTENLVQYYTEHRADPNMLDPGNRDEVAKLFREVFRDTTVGNEFRDTIIGDTVFIDKEIAKFFDPILEPIQNNIERYYSLTLKIETIEEKYIDKTRPELQSDTHAHMVLDDGSSHTQERTHVLNIPNSRKRVFIVAKTELDPNTGEFIRSGEGGPPYQFDIIEEAQKQLEKTIGAFEGDWTIWTSFYEENLKENWSPVHYSSMNNVMWLRADVRQIKESLEQAFVIHEMQSDWVQQAKKHGFADKSKFRAAEAKAKKAEFWASMSFKKILDTENTAAAVADPTVREAFDLFYGYAEAFISPFEVVPFTDKEIAEVLDLHVKVEGTKVDTEPEFAMTLGSTLRELPIGKSLLKAFDAKFNEEEVQIVQEEEAEYREFIDNEFYEMAGFLMSPNVGHGLFDIIQRAKAEGRRFEGYVHGKYIQGYPGLTDEFLKAIQQYIIKKAPYSPVTAEDIRNLNDVTFRNQFKHIGNQIPIFNAAYKLLSRVQLEKVQELFALWTDAAQFTSTIPKPPMHNTFHLYGIKRAVQQAVMEGLDYVAWPSSPKQVAQIERYGEVFSTPKGRHIVGANRAELEERVGVFQDPNSKSGYVQDLGSVELVLDHEIDRLETKDKTKNTLLYKPVSPKYRNVTAIMNRYLQDMPRSANKFFKKYNTQVELLDLAGIESKREPVQGIKITPELKQAVLKGLPVASKDEVTQAAYYKGNIHLAANTIETIDEVKGLLVHEGGHYLRRHDKKYQEKYQQLWDRFISLAGNPTSTRESIAIADAFQQAMREKDTLDKDLVREEALMYFLQNEANQDLGLVRRFINLIKQWLHRAFGLTPEQLNMTGQEMADIIVRDLKKIMKEKNTIDEEVTVETDKALAAAKKRDDIKEYKPDKAGSLLDDIFGVHIDKKTTEAQHERDAAMAVANLQLNARDAGVKAMAHLTNRIIKNDLGNVKAFERGKHEQTATWLNRIFSSPEYYFQKDTTAKRILDIAKNKNDIKYAWKKKVEGDFVARVRSIKKKNPKAYIRGNKYLLTTDQTGKGFSIITGEDGSWVVLDRKNVRIASFTNEQAAIATMIQSEADYLKKMGYNADTIEMIQEARELTNRGFDLTVQDMRRQIETARDQGNEEPKLPYTDDEGVKSEISLSEAITRMGDLRGTYFPRERQAKELQLTAQGEGKTNQLFTYNVYIPGNIKDFPSLTKLKSLFNKSTPVGKKIRELEKAGYTDLALKPVRNPAGMIFDVPGLLMSMDSLLSASDAKLSELELEEADKLILKTASEQLTLRIADIYKAKGQLSSRLRRSEILWEGYEPDALKALTSYAQRVSTGAAMRETARAMLLTFTGRDVPWKKYKEENPDASYRSYRILVKQKAINSTTQKKLYEDVRTYMTYVLKPDTRMDRTIGYLKALATLKFLGLRMSSAGINMTNMVMAVPATMSALTGQSITRSWGHVTEAADKYALWRLEQLKLTSDLSSTLQRKLERLSKGIVLSNKDRLIFEDISRRGWDEAQFNHESARVLQDSPNRAFDMALRVSMYMFGATEKANRAMTIFAAYKAHELAQKKKGVTRSHEFYMRQAQVISDRAHGTYGKAAKPWLVQKARVLDLPYTFLKFQHNYMLNMAEIGLKGFQTRKKLSAMKNVTYLLMAPAIVAGTGASLLAKLSFQIIKAMFDEPDPEEQFYEWFEDTFGEDTFMSRGARHGVTGAMFHINLRGSIQMNNPLPTDLSEVAGAPGAIATDLYDSLVYFSKAEWMKGAEKFFPTAAGSVIKARRESTEGVTTGTYLPVFYGSERLKADPIDAALRYLSFNPSRLSGIREKQWRELKVIEAYTKRRSEIKRKLNHMLVNGTASEEKWADIFNKIQEYNNNAMAIPDKYRITIINDKWVIRAIRDTEIPKKREKIRR